MMMANFPEILIGVLLMLALGAQSMMNAPTKLNSGGQVNYDVFRCPSGIAN
jgi:hypothetical protein